MSANVPGEIMKPVTTIKTTTHKDKRNLGLIAGLCIYAVVATLFISKSLK